MDAPSVSDAVKDLIEASRAQTDLILKISTAGIGAVLATAARVLGLKEDIRLTKFRHLWLLVLPLIAFVLSISAGYLILSAISGFRYELLTQDIKDSSLWFKKEYLAWFKATSAIQIISSVVGIIILASWYVLNVMLVKRGEAHETNIQSSAAPDFDI